MPQGGCWQEREAPCHATRKFYDVEIAWRIRYMFHNWTDLPKESGRFDLPLALGILAASGQMPADQRDKYEFAGELSLSGELRPMRGAWR